MDNQIRETDNDFVMKGYITNSPTEHNSYIVLNYGCHGEYVDYLLLNIELENYLKREYLSNFDLNNLYNSLENYNMAYINGFLLVKYKANDVEGFINDHEKYFLDGYFRRNIERLYTMLNDEVDYLQETNQLYGYR